MTGLFSVARAYGIDQVSPREWDACIADRNPFVSHAYLLALEKCGVATSTKGYSPRHILLRNSGGELVAAAPVYLKDHSETEMGSDLGWNLAHQRSVGPYYPKLQVESPATPVTGPRLLVRPGSDVEGARAALIETLRSDVVSIQVSSLHANFLKAEEWRYLKAHGFLCDVGIRFAWRNCDYANFEGFLTHLKSKKRVMIKREREEFSRTRLAFHRLEGRDITRQLIDKFYPLYASTYEKYRTVAPMTAEAFQHMRETMLNSMMFTTATLDGDLVAAVMFMYSEDTLYALHWGTHIKQRFLHYELTYYKGIEYAIERGFAHFDTGHGGVHKPPRGVLAVPSLNAHWFNNADFAKLIANGIENRIKKVYAHISELNRISPFKEHLRAGPDMSYEGY